MSKVTVTPELEAAIADVRSAAAAFSDETAHFANGRSMLRVHILCICANNIIKLATSLHHTNNNV